MKAKLAMKKFDETYKPKDLIDNEYRACEALGYLRCLREMYPELVDDCDSKISLIVMSLLVEAL